MHDRVEVNKSGTFYYKGPLLHRVDGPAIETVNGDKFWYVNGERHRDDGPACELIGGGRLWYKNNKPHRLDGPAMEFGSGGKIWCIDGVRIDEREFLRRTQDASRSDDPGLSMVPTSSNSVA